MIALMTEFQIFNHFVGRFKIANEVPRNGITILNAVLKHQAWPNQKKSIEMSYAQLGAETGLSRTTIIDALPNLAETGFVSMTRRSNSRTASYRYKVQIPDVHADDFIAATVSHLGRVAAKMLDNGMLDSHEDAVSNAMAGIRDTVLAAPHITEDDLEILKGRIEVQTARKVKLSL